MYDTVLTLPSKTLTGISYGDDSTFVSFYTRDIDSLFHEEGNQVHKLICYYPGKERKLIHYHMTRKIVFFINYGHDFIKRITI